MKLKNYISEASIMNMTLKHNQDLRPDFKTFAGGERDDIQRFLDHILRDCSKFLRETGGRPLYRGVGASTRKSPKKNHGTIVPRKDRRPLDTPKHIHDAMDKWFYTEFGWKARSEAVFCSNDYSVASMFGKGIVWAIYPIDGYEYIFDPGISDLADSLGEVDVDYGRWSGVRLGDVMSDVKGGPYEGWTYYDYLMDVLDNFNYTDRGLGNLVKSIHEAEVMLKCKQYYYIQSK